jgi:DOPA 4,5-dioxygenase
MFQVAFPVDLFASIAPWLMVNRGPLTIFLHPNTGKSLTDHKHHAVWMGRQRELNLGALSDEK